MRATILTSEFPPFIYGGVGVHLRYLINELRNSIDVDVRYLGTEATTTGNVSVTPFAAWDVAAHADDPGLAKALGPLSADIAMVSKRIGSDLVHAHTWYTFFAGFLAKTLYNTPLVVTVHSLEPKRPWKREQLGNGYELSTWMERTGIENADKVIAVSTEMRRDIIELYDVDPERVVVVYNGVDVDKYRPASAPEVRRKYGIEGPFALFVGRISRQKGIDVLLHAAGHIAGGLTLVLAATSPDTPGLKAEVEAAVEANPHVIWINEMVDEPSLIGLYSEADLFVCPSVYEPFGIINLEAMACGTPVVASAVGGITESVADGETGILVPPERPEELAEAINRLAADADLRKRFAQAGRQRVVDLFSWSTIARQTLDLYHSVTAR